MRVLFVALLLSVTPVIAASASAGSVLRSAGPLAPLQPSDVQLQGEIGRRFQASIDNRLLRIHPDQLLACFERKDCSGSWDGEYVGKWLDAAAISYAVTGNETLRDRLDLVARRLIATQDEDGYLGTYPKGSRFVFEGVHTSDVWVHRYVLLGLLGYYEVTRDPETLRAMMRAADLLVDTFGDEPGKRSLITVGFHQGLAATAVLEPMARLYALSRQPRYLEFCWMIVRSWDEPGGPRVLEHLLTGRPIQDLAGGKAYEILANVVGLVELYDVTGDRELLTASVRAWEAVDRNQLYLTGGSSRYERFQAPGVRPYSAADDIQENCVTVAWLRLNRRLLQITGEAQYAEAYLWSAYNQLLASQSHDASAWSYYCPLAGRKPFSTALTCCASSGPRGVAWFAESAVMAGRAGPAILLYTPGSYHFTTPGGRRGVVRISGDFPFTDRVTVTVEVPAAEAFSLLLLSPSWARGATVTPPRGGSRRYPAGPSFLELRRTWTGSEPLIVDFRYQARRVSTAAAHPGYGALTLGPLVLAYDADANPGHQGSEFRDLQLSRARIRALRIGLTGDQRIIGPVFEVPVRASRAPGLTNYRLRPWALAGDRSGYVRVLLPERDPPADEPLWSLFSYWSRESQSAPGNVSGSFADESVSSFSVTFNGRPQDDAWFALEAPRPVTFTRVTYCHGRSFHDGGWFDASAGAPRFEIQRSPGAAWEDLAAVAGYPETTGASPASLLDGQCFSTDVPTTMAVGIRVRGRPASGDTVHQQFASCSELQAHR